MIPLPNDNQNTQEVYAPRHKLALAYIRVSTRIQADAGTHENQKTAILDYAARHGLELLPGSFPNGSWYVDLASSGASEDREALLALLERVRDAGNVIFYDWSRVARDQLYAGYLLYEFNKKHVSLHDVSKDRKVELDDADQVFMQQLESYFAHKERAKINERQRAGIARFIETHGRWGKKERTLTDKEENQYVKLRRAGVPKTAIARLFGMSRNTLYREIKRFGLEELGPVPCKRGPP